MENLHGAEERERMHDVAFQSALLEFLVESCRHSRSESGETSSLAGLTMYQEHQLKTKKISQLITNIISSSSLFH